MPAFRIQWTDNNSDPLSSGSLEFFDSGTSTPRAVFSDTDLTVSAGTIVTLNSAGFAQVSGSEVTLYLSPVAYRVVVKNSAGTTLRTADGVYALQAASSVNLDIADAVAGETLSANDLVYLSDGSGARTAGRWYRADADTFAFSLHVSLGFATAAIASGATGTVRIGGVLTGLSGLSAGSTYYVSGTAAAITSTAPTNARPVGMAVSASVLVIDFSPMWIDPMAFTCDGRITLTTAVAVTTADVTAATTLYFTPYKGNRLALFDGSRWKLFAFTELSIAVPATTSTMYDVFVYDNAGTLTLELTAWTNDTTRATAITLQNGVYVRSAATTRRYLGSFRTTTVSGQTEDSLARRFVWNYYNRVPRVLRRLETTATWTYTTATIRQANGAAANQVDVVVGVAGEAYLEAMLYVDSYNASAGIARSAGFGEDSTTAYMATQIASGITAGYPATTDFAHVAAIRHYPAIGRHFYAWLEDSTATGTTTWAATNSGVSFLQAGIVGSIDG
jgi:hypothetical protein